MQELLPTLEIKPQKNHLTTSAFHHRSKNWSTHVIKLTENIRLNLSRVTSPSTYRNNLFLWSRRANIKYFTDLTSVPAEIGGGLTSCASV